MRTQVEESFSEFYEKWVTQLESDLELLLKASGEAGPHPDALVGRLTAHHKSYYTAKWAAAHKDVLAFFSPVWLSPLENAYSWMTGWKPSTVFRLVGRAGLREEQAKRVEELRAKIRVEEDKVEREMERQQVAVADWRMVDRGDAALKTLLAGLEKVMKMADCARLKTLKGILEVLDPSQRVNLLAATTMLQIQLKRLGQKKQEKERNQVVVIYPRSTNTTSDVAGSLVIV